MLVAWLAYACLATLAGAQNLVPATSIGTAICQESFTSIPVGVNPAAYSSCLTSVSLFGNADQLDSLNTNAYGRGLVMNGANAVVQDTNGEMFGGANCGFAITFSSFASQISFYVIDQLNFDMDIRACSSSTSCGATLTFTVSSAGGGPNYFTTQGGSYFNRIEWRSIPSAGWGLDTIVIAGPPALFCGSDPCSAVADCYDSPNSCICQDGYEGTGMGANGCTEINGCSPNPCGTNADCFDQPPPSTGASCVCRSGFSGNGYSCTNIDACASYPCDTRAQCVDSFGGPVSTAGRTCTCNDGLTGSGEPGQCNEANGCTINPCDVNADCVDSPYPATSTARTCSCRSTHPFGAGNPNDCYTAEIRRGGYAVTAGTDNGGAGEVLLSSTAGGETIRFYVYSTKSGVVLRFNDLTASSTQVPWATLSLTAQDVSLTGGQASAEFTVPFGGGTGWQLNAASVTIIDGPASYSGTIDLGASLSGKSSFGYPVPSIQDTTLEVITPAQGPTDKIDTLVTVSEKMLFRGTNLAASTHQLYYGTSPGDLRAFQCTPDVAASNSNLLVFDTSNSATGLDLVFTIVYGNGPTDQVTGSDTYSYTAEAPIVNTVSGCTLDVGDGTSGCPTAGRITVTITGSSFGANSPVLIDGRACTNMVRTGVPASTELECTLPAGAGLGRAVLVGSSGGVLSIPRPLLSYSPPTITSVSGGPCVQDSATTLVDCKREGGGRLTLVGTNFGEESLVLVGSARCASPNYVGTTHTELNCLFPSGNTILQSVFILVTGGELSAPGPTVSYQSCPVGFYQANQDIACTECSPGRYSPAVSNENCLQCDAGRFANSTGAVSCELCPAGSFQSEVGEDHCVMCAAGLFSDSTGKVECQECERGRYSPVNGSTDCLKCAPGSAQPEPASVSCEECLPGYSAAFEGLNVCVSCEAGSATNRTNSTACEPCAEGFAQPNSAQSECIACQPGSYGIGEGRAECRSCETGRFQSEGQKTTCERCTAGFYQAENGAVLCDSCVAGRFTERAGLFECNSCPIGRFAENDTASSCEPCPGGKFQNDTEASYCFDCLPGSFSEESLTGRSSCELCPEGKFTAKYGTVSCEVCPLGKAQSKWGASECVDCVTGRKASTTGLAQCSPCTPGTYTNSTGTVECVECAPGKVQPNVATASECEPCTAGRASSDGKACSPCTGNDIADAPGFPECVGCPLGSLADNALACYCPKNFYSKGSGADVKCYACPKGASCDARTTLTALPLKPGFWRNGTSSTQLLRCLYRDHCQGGGNSQCDLHRVGVLCFSCAPGHASAGPSQACAKCQDKGVELGLSIGFGVLLLLVVCCMYAVVLRADRGLLHFANEVALGRHDSFSGEIMGLEELSSQGSGSKTVVRSQPPSIAAMPVSEYFANWKKLSRPTAPIRSSSFLYKMKIFVGFTQVSVTIMHASHVPWPSQFAAFMSYIAFLNFDFIPWQSFSCVAEIDYLIKALVVGIVPLAILLLLFVFFWLPHWCMDRVDYSDDGKKKIARDSQRAKFVKLLSFTLFFMYPHVSSTVIGVYNCIEINGKSYLTNDLRLFCFTPRWNMFAAINSVFALLYPIGIPLFYWFMFMKNRANFNTPRTLYQLGFLYEAFAKNRWYFELVDMLFKAIMTSVLVFWPIQFQMLFGIVVAGLYLIVLLCVDPYVRKGDMRLHLLCITEILLICMIGHTIETQESNGFDPLMEILLSILMISLVCALFILFMVMSGRNVKKMLFFRRREKLRKQSSKAGIDFSGSLSSLQRESSSDFPGVFGEDKSNTSAARPTPIPPALPPGAPGGF